MHIIRSNFDLLMFHRRKFSSYDKQLNGLRRLTRLLLRHTPSFALN